MAKTLLNIPYNGLCTVLDSDTEVIRTNAASRQAIDDLMQEVQRAARACGFDIEDAFLELMVANTDEMGPYLPSMLLDRRNQRTMEADYLFAKPIDAAMQAGCPTPKIELLYQQLLLLNR